jgi:peptide/nickel transport system substrate-binding protein
MRVVMAAMRLAKVRASDWRRGFEGSGRSALVRHLRASAGRRQLGRRRRLLGGGCALVALGLLVAACGPMSGGSSVGTTPVSGGTVTYATTPGFNANYIFPFTTASYFTVTNTDDFQFLMYRPLYWFGDGQKPYLNKGLSLAYPPVYQQRTVTITLKHYKWSDGTSVTAQNVIFFINMMKAQERTANYFGGYVQGYFPDNVTNVHAVNARQVQMTITGPYSPDWFTDNELSQVTPMPSAWDVTGPNKHSDCEHVIADCTAVFNYLYKNAVSPTKWAAFGLWDIVDGPFKLVSATTQGDVKMTYNNAYSGRPAAHHITNFELVPFISEQAEFNVLQDPQGSQKIDVGYLPTVDAPAPPAGSQVGQNPASLTGYKLGVLYPWELSYFPYNFNDPKAGPIFKQLYVRQALQSLVDQEGVINGPMHGYGKTTIGPVAAYPVTSYLSSQLANAGDQWTLNPNRAESLLSSHGWKLIKGVQTCQRPGTGPADCGAHIAAGTQMKFTLGYFDGQDFITSQVKELVSNASQVGIDIAATGETATTVIDDVFAGSAPWQMAEWGVWTYAPDYLPTGEELFGTTSVDNGGHYSNPTNDAYIAATLRARTSAAFKSAMDKWQNYLSRQLPVVYVPTAANLIESVNNLYIGKQDPTLTITPEDWYYLR